MRSARWVLVTGATGFLGSHLVRQLLATGFSVAILKRSFSDTHRIQDVISDVHAYDIDCLSDLSLPFDRSHKGRYSQVPQPE